MQKEVALTVTLDRVLILCLIAALMSAAMAAADYRPVADVVMPVTGDETDLVVFPPPRNETYTGRALRLDTVTVEAGGLAGAPASRLLAELVEKWDVPRDDDAAARIVLRVIDPPVRWAPAPEQGYLLTVEADGEGIVIEIAGGGEAGVFYGIQTLRQLVHEHEDGVYVLEAEIEDWPSVRYRGPVTSLEDVRWKMNFMRIDGGWPPSVPRSISIPRGELRERRDALKTRIEGFEQRLADARQRDEDPLADDELFFEAGASGELGDAFEEWQIQLFEERREEAQGELAEIEDELAALDDAYERHKQQHRETLAERVQRYRDHHIEPLVHFRHSPGYLTDSEDPSGWGRLALRGEFRAEDRYSPEEEADLAVRKAKEAYGVWHEAGVRKFAISFRIGFHYTLREHGHFDERAVDPLYGELMTDIVERLVLWLKSLSGDNRLFLQPHKNATRPVRIRSGRILQVRDAQLLARALMEAGLSEEVELWWHGSGELVPRITAADARVISETYGGRSASFLDLSKVEGEGAEQLGRFHVYSTRGGIGRFIGNGPMEAHEPELAGHIDIACLPGWGGRAWGWNTEGYEPELVTAVKLREWTRTMGAGPDAYRELAALAHWQQRHNAYIHVAKGGSVSALLADGQNALSAEEVDSHMRQRQRFYDARMEALRQALRGADRDLPDHVLPPRSSRHAPRDLLTLIEGEVRGHMRYLRGKALALKRRPTATAVRAKGPIVLDGRLDEEAWEAAPRHGSSFKGVQQIFGRIKWKPLAHPRTTFRVVYDDDHVYVGVWCEEPGVENISASKGHIPGRMSPEGQESVMSGNYLRLIVGPEGPGRRGTRLTTTLHGQRIVGSYGAYRYPTDPGPLHPWQWPRDFDVATRRTEDGWVAEFRFDLEDLDPAHRPRPGRRWGWNVIRKSHQADPGTHFGQFMWQQHSTFHDRAGTPANRGEVIYIGMLEFE